MLDLQKMRDHVWRNLTIVADALHGTVRATHIKHLQEPGHFTFDGSVALRADARLHYPTFFDGQRSSIVCSQRLLRGPRYLVSIDPTLEVRQKLLALRDDLNAAVKLVCGSQRKRQQGFQSFLELSGVLDYAKNAAITILNALIQPEKKGHFRLSDRPYQRVRRQALTLAMLATRTYYGHLLAVEREFAAGLSALRKQLASIDAIIAHIEKEYREGTFSSRFFTRPEAGHPLVLSASAFLTCRQSSSRPDVIIGLPSGGTELAILQHLMCEIVHRARVPLLLVPYSLHTVKHQVDAPIADHVAEVVDYLKHATRTRAPRSALLADDNSSTGRTIQFMVDAMASAWPGVNVTVSVAEADVIRSAIDRHAPHRAQIASNAVHLYAVNILPVSRHLAPKVDLKELAERRRLAARYRQLLSSARRDVEAIQFRVFLRLILEPTSAVLDADAHAGGVLPPSQSDRWDPVGAIRRGWRDRKSINDFTNTFLSNFYITPRPILYDGVQYPSVEHAYQAQKFLYRTLANVVPTHVAAIKDLMRSRGHKWDADDVGLMFRDAKVSAGSVKRTADYLRSKGYVRKDWDDIKVGLMIELLLQKFRQAPLRKDLLKTSGKYLVEGNTWRDTLWGVYMGRGRNLLGLVLMEIRDVLEREKSGARGLKRVGG